jgi:hypothetical protein
LTQRGFRPVIAWPGTRKRRVVWLMGTIQFAKSFLHTAFSLQRRGDYATAI